MSMLMSVFGSICLEKNCIEWDMSLKDFKKAIDELIETYPLDNVDYYYIDRGEESIICFSGVDITSHNDHRKVFNWFQDTFDEDRFVLNRCSIEINVLYGGTYIVRIKEGQLVMEELK